MSASSLGITGPTVPAASRLYRFVAWFAYAVMRIQRWQITVQGAEHLPRTSGAVIVANHTSFWDFFTTGHLPYRGWGRPVRILAKQSLFDLPVFGAVMRRAGHIPVHRGSGRRALSSAVTAVQAGELVLVLPEQTISPAFELLEFKRGAARMAAEAGVPIVPAVSWGSHRFHTVGHAPRWSWRLPVTIRYGAPVLAATDDDPGVVMAAVRSRMAALLDEVQRTYPDGAPAGAWWVPARLGGGAPTPADVEPFLAGLRERWHGPGRRRPHRSPDAPGER